jgi:hypothetical protein
MNTEVNTPSTNNNQNSVRVSNQLNLTINLGDSLNLLAIIAGIYLVRKIAKRKKLNVSKGQ